MISFEPVAAVTECSGQAVHEASSSPLYMPVGHSLHWSESVLITPP